MRSIAAFPIHQESGGLAIFPKRPMEQLGELNFWPVLRIEACLLGKIVGALLRSNAGSAEFF